MFWDFLGRRSYEDALGLQLRLREAIRRGEGSEHFLLLEHPHVFTLGRNARPEDVLASPAWLLSAEVEVHECDRGGQVTYHGPGQLVGYPIVNLSPDRRDIRRFVRDLQEVLIRTLEHYGIVAERREGKDFIGLWVGTAKIASIGVHLSRWISTHGFALNLSTDLSFFRGIVPCGLTGVEMTSAEAVSGRRLPLAEVASVCARIFAEVFDRDLVRGVRGPAVEAPHRPDVLAVR
ncbi:MAG: lipoyl(octanoyl) transferase LipB [Acidobacteria bacterium]|nr:lipoyl(octanoyl) transferase LipB [Acidobacteriota bacterium]